MIYTKHVIIYTKTCNYLHKNRHNIFFYSIKASKFKKVFDMAIGAMKSQVISAAAELKIADFLKDAPKGIDEIAEHTTPLYHGLPLP